MQQTFDFQFGIEIRAHALDGADQIRQSLQCVVLALHRDHHRLRSGQSVDRQQIQRRRAIDQDEIVFGSNRLQRVLETGFAVLDIDQFDFSAGQFAIRRQDIVAGVRSTLAYLGNLFLAEQHLIHGCRQATLVDAAAHSGVPLRIEIDQQHTALHRRQARREIDPGGGLADTAFLVSDGDDAYQAATAGWGWSRAAWRSAPRPGTFSGITLHRRNAPGTCASSSWG